MYRYDHYIFIYLNVYNIHGIHRGVWLCRTHYLDEENGVVVFDQLVQTCGDYREQWGE
jgi:hypothetical protein